MFSVISSYIFGGEKAPAETPVDYDIREDEEWMLVDVSGDKENVPKTAIKNDENAQNLDKSSYDEIENLTEGEEVPYDETFECISSSPDYDKQTIPYANSFQSMDISVDPSWEIPSSIFYGNSLNYLQKPHKSKKSKRKSVLRVFKEDNLLSDSKADLTPNNQEFSTKLQVTGFNGTKVLYDVICSTNPRQPNICMKLREVANSNKQQEAENIAMSMAAIKSKSTCRIRRPPVEPKTPVKMPKKDYMQQMQALMQQQTKESQSKKYYDNKAHMNRMNKVAMYDSSNKNRHRRDLWQHHSGANNNRKCY